jgi:hypothetical protein
MASEAFWIAIAKFCASTPSVYKSGAVDNDIQAMSANIATAAVGLIQATIAEWGGDIGKTIGSELLGELQDVVNAKPTTWLDGAIIAVSALECINGFGNPDKAPFLTGVAAERFDNVLSELELAYPDELRWSGEGAQAYGELNRKIQQCVEKVQATDRELQGYVKKQAEAVLEIRRQFLWTKTALNGFIPIAWAVYARAYVKNLALAPAKTGLVAGSFAAMVWAKAEALKETKTFQKRVIAGEFTALMFELMNYIYKEVAGNVTAMRNSVPAHYDDAKKMVSLPQSTAPRQAVPTTTRTSADSAFPTLSGAGGGASRAPSRPYPVAGGAGVRADVSTTEPVLPKPRPTSDGPAAPSGPVTPAAASAAAFTAPSVAQGTQTTRAAVDPAQPMDPRKPTAAPGERVTARESVPGASVEGAVAAMDAEAAERAPIEAAANSSGQAQEPTLGQARPATHSAWPTP